MDLEFHNSFVSGAAAVELSSDQLENTSVIPFPNKPWFLQSLFYPFLELSTIFI